MEKFKTNECVQLIDNGKEIQCCVVSSIVSIEFRQKTKHLAVASYLDDNWRRHYYVVLRLSDSDEEVAVGKFDNYEDAERDLKNSVSQYI